MQSFSSSAPAPSPDHGLPSTLVPEAVPEPKLVPPQPDRRRRLVLWVAVLALVLAGAAAALYQANRSAARASGKAAVASIPVAAVSAGDLNVTIRANGTVAAENFAALMAPRIQGSRTNFNRGGTNANFGGVQTASGGGGLGPGPMGDFSLILMNLAKPGALVKPGDTVAEFDPQMQQQRLDDYKDAVIQNANMLRKMEANLAAIREAHDQSVRAAKAAWQQALLDLQTIPIRSAIDAENYKLAAEQTESTYKQLLFEASLVVESQMAQIRATELNQQQTTIEMQRAQINLQKMTVKSPMQGIVVMPSIVRNGELGQVREGDQVMPGQTFMQIVDLRSLVLNATVNQVDAEKLRLGMKAAVQLDAYPEFKTDGTLIGIGALSKTSTFRAGYVGEIPILIKIDHTDPRMIPDLTGSAEIVLSSEKNTLIAPREAVFEEAGGPFVFLQGPEGWIRRKVEEGPKSFTGVAIRSGVQKGDLIATQHPL